MIKVDEESLIVAFEEKTDFDKIMVSMYRGMVIDDETDIVLREFLNREFALWCGKNNITKFPDLPIYRANLSLKGE